MWPEPALRVATPPADDVIDPLRYDITCAGDEPGDTAAGDGQVGAGDGGCASAREGRTCRQGWVVRLTAWLCELGRVVPPGYVESGVASRY